MRLAAKDLPRNRAVGPDEFPAEVYKYCAALHKALAGLFNGMIEWNMIPDMLSKFYVVPLDKA